MCKHHTKAILRFYKNIADGYVVVIEMVHLRLCQFARILPRFLAKIGQMHIYAPFCVSD